MEKGISGSSTSLWASPVEPGDRKGRTATQEKTVSEVRKGEEPKQEKMRVKECGYPAQKQRTIWRTIGIKQVPRL